MVTRSVVQQRSFAIFGLAFYTPHRSCLHYNVAGHARHALLLALKIDNDESPLKQFVVCIAALRPVIIRGT